MRKTITIDLPELKALKYPALLLKHQHSELLGVVAFLMNQARAAKDEQIANIYKDSAMLLEALRIALTKEAHPSTVPPYEPDSDQMSEDGRAILAALRELSRPMIKLAMEMQAAIQEEEIKKG